MSHYAKVENNIVTQVIVAEQDFVDALSDSDLWIQTSYNTRGGIHYAPNSKIQDDGTPLRKNYAGIGFTYDAIKDAFIPPQPYSSWVLNEDTCGWDSPVPYPTDDKRYEWNEETTSWISLEAN